LNSVSFRGDEDRKCYPENTKNTTPKFPVRFSRPDQSGHLCLGQALSKVDRNWLWNTHKKRECVSSKRKNRDKYIEKRRERRSEDTITIHQEREEERKSNEKHENYIIIMLNSTHTVCSDSDQ